MPLDSRVSPGDRHLASSPPFLGLKLPARFGARLKLMFSVRRALGASSQEVTPSPRPQHEPKSLVIVVFCLFFLIIAHLREISSGRRLHRYALASAFGLLFIFKNPLPETHKHNLLI